MADTTPRYRIGSLFSGYGGTDLAVLGTLGSAGLRGRVVWHSDIKPAAVALLAHRYPEVPNLGDLTQIWPVDRNHPERALPARDTAPIDVMVASWPCQPESAAGRRLGEKDPRALWPHVARAIAVTRPAIFFGENVARITSNGSLRRVVRSLAQLGYVGAWRVLSAADRGACHLRKRCFVVALDPAAHARGETGRLPGHTQPSDSAGATRVREAQPRRRDDGAVTLLPTPTQRDVHGAGAQGRRQGGLNLRTAVTLLPTPTARDVKGPRCRGLRRDGSPRTLRQADLATATISLLPTPTASSYGTNHGGSAGRVGPKRESLDTMARHGRLDALLPTPTVADARNTRNATANRAPSQHYHGGWTLSDVAHAGRWGIYTAAITRHEITLGRPAPAPTQISTTTGKSQLRPHFVEWMMMLPEGWVTSVPHLVDSPRRSERLAMLSLLGDGVVPAQAAYAFGFLLHHLARRLDMSMTA